jgi:LPXTG-motif cell wall-anchored protein
MRKKILRYLLWISASILALFSVHPVLADGGDPRLEISPERLNPGDVVVVRGVSFARDASIALALIGSGVEISFGELIADAEGEFTYTVALPSDLVEGAYYFRATTSHNWVISPPFTVWGIAVVGEDVNAFREQSDVELGPIPTFIPAEPGVATASAPIVSAPAESSPTSLGLDASANILILAGLMVLVALVVLTLGRKRRSA